MCGVIQIYTAQKSSVLWAEFLEEDTLLLRGVTWTCSRPWRCLSSKGWFGLYQATCGLSIPSEESTWAKTGAHSKINIGAGKDRQNHWAGDKTFLSSFTEALDTSDRTKSLPYRERLILAPSRDDGEWEALSSGSFTPFLRHLYQQHPSFFGNIGPRWQQEPKLHLTHLHLYARTGAQPNVMWCPPTWWPRRHEEVTQCCAWWAPHMPLLLSFQLAICPCRNRVAHEGTTHDVPALAAPEHPLLCIRKLQVMSWHEFITPGWFCPMEDFPVLDICQWMTRNEDFLAFSCLQTSTQAHFFGDIASILRPQ